MVPKINELKNIMKSQKDWQLLVEMKEEKVLIQTKKSVRGLTICRAQGPVEWSPLDVWRCLSNPKYVSEWNIGLEKMHFCKKVGVNAYIYQIRQKSRGLGKLPVRDFVMNYICNLESDGSVVVVYTTQNCNYVDDLGQ